MSDSMIDRAYTTQILQKLVQINSVNPGLDPEGPGEKEICDFIEQTLHDLEVQTERDEPAPGRVNVMGRIKGSGGGKSLMLNAHTDTVGVEGMDDPFSGKIEGDKLFGRGSYDMKGGIAAMLGAAKRIKDSGLMLKGDLIISFVADEEFESIGAIDLAKKLSADAAIVTEPTDLKLCPAHRGFGVFKVTTKGKTAHGGRHKDGIDANLMMGKLLARLSELSERLPREKTHPLCGEASLHVPLISGGRSLFIYSNECTINIERRTIPGETLEQVTMELQSLIDQLKKENPTFQANLECELWRNPYESDNSTGILSACRQSASNVLGEVPDTIGHTWWEDSAIFGEAGIDTIIFGPAGDGIHEEVEWVDLKSVETLANILFTIAKRFCGSSEAE